MTTSTFNLSTALATYSVGQKRTGANKQFVFLTPEHAIKGPYSSHRLNNVLYRSKVFAAWGTPCVVLPSSTFECPDGTFVCFPNLDPGLHTTYPHKESFSDYSYQVIERRALCKISDVIEEQPWIYNQLEDLLLALCHAYLLNTGDTGLYNILVDIPQKRLYLIDYDDDSSKERDGPCFYFSKPPASRVGWYEKVKSSYHSVAQRLERLREDEQVKRHNLLPRLELTIKMLQQHGEPAEQVQASSALDPQVQASSALDPQVQASSALDPQVQASLTPQIKPNIMGRKIVIRSKVTLPNPKGKMEWKGLLGGSTTFHGLTLDVAKSALQKYIRRGLKQQAQYAAVELYRMSEVDGKPAVSNLYNRLAVIAAEDIGSSNLGLVLTVISNVLTNNRDFGTLLSMVSELADSKKTRIMSHAWNAYVNPEGRKVAQSKGIALHQGDEELSGPVIEGLYLDTDPESVQPYIQGFLHCLQEGDFNAFSWVGFYLEHTKDLTLKKRKKYLARDSRSFIGRPDILLWYAMRAFLTPEIHDILIDAYYTLTENRPFLSLAIIISLYGLREGMQPLPASANLDLTSLKQGKYTLTIEDYVLDKHTNKGREAGKGAKDFVHEGSLVIPQDPKFHDPLLEEIYKERS